MLLLTGIVMVTGVFMSWNIQSRTKDFFVLFMTLVAGVYGVFLSMDLFFLFFFYELAIVPMYLLIGVWGSTRKEYGALKLVLYLVASSAVVWVALIAIYVESGLGSFDLLDLKQVEYGIPAFNGPCSPCLWWDLVCWPASGHFTPGPLMATSLLLPRLACSTQAC